MSLPQADDRHRLLALLRGNAVLWECLERVARWRRCWPDLTVLPWDDGIGVPRRT